MTLRLRKVYPDAILPTRKHQFDAGVDLYAYHDSLIPPWSQSVIDTGIELVELPEFNVEIGIPYRVEVPFNREWATVLQIWPKSGNDAKWGAHTGAGIVDYLYRGRILVLLKNQSENTLIIKKGDAIAQAVIVPCYIGEVEEVFENNETERGASGGIVNEV